MAAPKRKFYIWVLVDKKGNVWRYTSGMPVMWSMRIHAAAQAKSLHKATGWKPARAQVTVKS